MADGVAGFWDRMAEKYARQPVADEASYTKKLEITRGYLRPDMEVLEFGCGTGTTAIVHAPHVRRIRAVDVSEKMLGIARGKAAADGVSNIDFEQGTIEALEAPEASFDVVLGLSILHLVDDREAVIAKVRRLLKPGGLFISSTACIGDTLPAIRLIAPLGRALGLLPLLRVFTREELRRSIEQAGFSIEHDWLPGKGKAVFMVARKAGD